MDTSRKNYSKFSLNFFLALAACLVVRLIPFRVPNVEPILATTMPLGKVYGALMGFSFTVLSILLYDITTHTLGMQTFFTAGAYGVVGLLSVYYFKKHQASRGNYVRFAIMGTLFYDAMTGLTVGPIFFHQSFLGSLLGQIPFTALHLLGNVVFAFALSPAIYNFLIRKKIRPPADLKKELCPTLLTLQPKII